MFDILFNIVYLLYLIFQVGPIPAMPPGQLPSSLWDLHAKEIKTEQQILVNRLLSFIIVL